MKEIILIDGNYWLFSAYFATATMGNLMVNKDGIPTNAVYGFANMLESVMKDEPTNILVAFDAKGKTFRSEMLEEYKGHRKKTPDELICQFDTVKEYLDARNVKHFELSGFEGDDILGTVATMAANEDYQVTIMTSDKDMMQLINDKITILKKNSKTKSFDRITVETFKEQFGILPPQMKDLLGLMGDSSDNIPGIPGVGEKTALKYIIQYDSVEGLQENMHDIKGKIGEKIRENINLGILSKQLATIKVDVEIPFDIEATKYQGFEYQKLSDFYLKYDMQSLLKRLSLSQSAPKKADIQINVVKQCPPIIEDSALVVEYYGQNYHKAPILGFGIYNQNQSFFIGLQDAFEDAEFKKFIGNLNIKKYGFDIKASILASKWHSLEIQGYDFDLELAAYVINPSLGNEIKSVCEYFDYIDVFYDEEIYGKGAKMKIPEVNEIAKSAIHKAKAIYELKNQVIEQLKEIQGFDLYYNIELQVAFILADMEFKGTKINKDKLIEMQNQFMIEIKQLETNIYELAGKEFNISSPKQLGEVLFDDLQLPFAKKTKTGYSTAVDVLEKLEKEHPIIALIMNYRTLTKLYSTYIIGLQEQQFDDGCIHTIYHQALTATGRLSSTDPNLQNIPIKSKEGRMLRLAFEPKLDQLVSFDYSQIELRILAHLANEKSLIEAFNQKLDIHSYTASIMFNVPIESVDDQMRRKAKAINFGIIYGMSDFGLSKQVDISVAQAKEFIQTYFTSYPEIQAYMDCNIEFAKANGFVKTMFERRRYISEINDSNFMKRELGKRLAMNSPIQGTGADILKIAMIKVDSRLKQENLQSHLILQVHDELILDVVNNELKQVMDIVKFEMENACKMAVTLQADGNHGQTWYDLK